MYGKEFFFGGGGAISGAMPGVTTVGDINTSGVKYCTPVSIANLFVY